MRYILDQQDIELAKMEVSTIKQLMKEINDLPPSAPYEVARPILKKMGDLMKDWRYHLASLYVLRERGRFSDEVSNQIYAYEHGMHRRQHGE